MPPKPKCLCDGMNKSTGNFCGFLDHAAQELKTKCEIKGCQYPVPAAWLARERKRRRNGGKRRITR